jgi:hypothetical protein
MGDAELKNIHTMRPEVEWTQEKCTYCGAMPATRDHVPSRVLLDEPFPTNLPVVSACEDCNNGFSLDEQYLACLIECAMSGSAEPESVHRGKIQRILMEKPAFAALIASCRRENESGVFFGCQMRQEFRMLS